MVTCAQALSMHGRTSACTQLLILQGLPAERVVTRNGYLLSVAEK